MSMLDSLPQLLTINQLADRLGSTPRHVRRLVAERPIRSSAASCASTLKRSPHGSTSGGCRVADLHR